MTEITVQKIQEAYSRLKAYVYYDNFNLTLRADLASFENDPDLKKKLLLLATELSEYLKTGKLSERLIRIIADSSYIVLPKSFKNGSSSQKKNGLLISNQHTEEYFV